MPIIELSIKQYDRFISNLNNHVYRDPLDITYRCDIKVNSDWYQLCLQVCPRRRLNPVQAVRLRRDGEKRELVTDKGLLGALTELVVAQYGGDR